MTEEESTEDERVSDIFMDVEETVQNTLYNKFVGKVNLDCDKEEEKGEDLDK